MNVFAIDDEKAMLNALHNAIAIAAPGASVWDFQRYAPVLEALESGVVPDIVFCDIELPGMNGITLAKNIRAVAPHAKVVFVTAYPGYALEAFQLHANGFVLKPVEASRVREELDALFGESAGVLRERLLVRCLGQFEVFWREEPLAFPRALAKELFAYLVDREGQTCTAGEIIGALWEGDASVKRHGSYLRVLTQSLKSVLDSVGMGDVLVRRHNQWSVRTALLDCDYYRLLAGDPEVLRAWDGEYMSQYSWAEPTAARLQFMYGRNER